MRLVVNDDSEEIGAKAANGVRGDATFIENLLSASGMLYDFFGRNAELSPFLLWEMFFYECGAQAERLSKTRERMIGTVIRIVEQAKARKELNGKIDADLAGRVLISVYQLEVRIWLSKNKLRRADGLAQLETSLVATAMVSPIARALLNRAKRK